LLKKLRFKFVLINMVIVTAMLVIIFSLVYQFTKTNLENQSISMVKSLAQTALQPGNNADVRLPHFTLQINMFGEVIASGSSHYDLTDESFLQTLINEVFRSKSPMDVIEGYDLLYYRTSALGSHMVAFVDISSQRITLSLLVQISVLIGIVSIAVFLLISLFLARWAVKPVEKAWQQQRQFVSDASHELKTPLTVIINNAELLQDPDRDRESTQRYAAGILTMSGQMRELVERLLELARADNGQVRKSFAPLDLSGLVSDALLPFEPVFYERGMTLAGQIEQHIRVNGSDRYLRQVVEILLDNALKYSDPGVVSVTLTRQGRQCLLRVSNPGTPIPKEELERIFRRFYRVDKARTGGSFGLGLSIAESITQEHGGKIWAQSNQSGNCFFVQLPTM